MYQHLFVPVDGSELSHRAMDGSIALAVTIQNADTFADRIKRHEAKNTAHANALLGQFEERAKAAGVAFSGLAVVAYGVDHTIVEEAEKAGCDMIVMVTHGRGPVGEFLFGSHTKKVIAQSKLPVFVLH